MIRQKKPTIAAVIAALLGAAVAASTAGADQKTLRRLLPSGKAIRAGWAEVAKSFQYGAGDGLTGIYDGGYQMYLDRGVVEAAQVSYHSKAGYTVLTIHTMKSGEACRDFFQYWRKGAAEQGKVLPLELSDAAFFSQPSKTITYGYLRTGRFLLIADVNLGGDTGVKVLRSFLESVSKAVADLHRPPAKKRPPAAS